MNESKHPSTTKSEEMTKLHRVCLRRGYEISPDGTRIKWIDLDDDSKFCSRGFNIAFRLIPPVLHQNPQVQQMSMDGIILDTKYTNLSELKRIKNKLIVPKLIIQGNFNQPISQEDFPPSVKQVRLGYHYDCPLVDLPFTHVHLCRDFNELIQMENLLSIVFERYIGKDDIKDFVDYLGSEKLQTPKLIHVRLGETHLSQKLLQTIQQRTEELPASLQFICYQDLIITPGVVHLGKINGKWQVINSECNCHDEWNTDLYCKRPESTGTGLF